jgi:hypothetical protein
MNQEDWETLDAIRKELNANLMAYNPETHEKFSALFVKSLEGKGDGPVRAVSPTPTPRKPSL